MLIYKIISESLFFKDHYFNLIHCCLISLKYLFFKIYNHKDFKYFHSELHSSFLVPAVTLLQNWWYKTIHFFFYNPECGQKPEIEVLSGDWEENSFLPLLVSGIFRISSACIVSVIRSLWFYICWCIFPPLSFVEDRPQELFSFSLRKKGPLEFLAASQPASFPP